MSELDGINAVLARESWRTHIADSHERAAAQSQRLAEQERVAAAAQRAAHEDHLSEYEHGHTATELAAGRQALEAWRREKLDQLEEEMNRLDPRRARAVQAERRDHQTAELLRRSAEVANDHFMWQQVGELERRQRHADATADALAVRRLQQLREQAVEDEIARDAEAAAERHDHYEAWTRRGGLFRTVNDAGFRLT